MKFCFHQTMGQWEVNGAAIESSIFNNIFVAYNYDG